ncbi:MAG: LysR family transcriptional regulator [Alphaproteobacteria bacterium]|nr:LysR family transcriptional regulator [Alphaproteobacteria bacterium]MCW5739335.1 LysR family transcriptional regulator [Alphaproteobacteria bacterium]
MRALPSLNGVKAFEAAARRGGFAGAAEELGVTPAAISRLVRLLEARLAVPLFERRANGLRLTPAGIAFRDGLTPILDSLATLTAQICDAARGRVLTVGVGPTFAIRWLIPRLAAFRAEAPEVEVRITTGGATVPFAEDWTCGIRLGDGDWPGFVAERLFAADLSPVCAPSAAARLRKPEDLRRATLLRVAHAREDWPSWLKAAGLGELRVDGPLFEYYGHALQAAADGLGVAMGIRPYIDDDLAAGRLVAPFPLSVPKGTSWYLVYRPHRAVEEGFKAFRSWIAAAALRPARARSRRAKG